MDRSHVYIVPEEEIQVKPSTYLGYIRKYGKVVFVVSVDLYLRNKESFEEFHSIVKVSGMPPQDSFDEFVAKHGLGDHGVSFGLFSFMVTTINRGFKMSVEKRDDDEVWFTIAQ